MTHTIETVMKEGGVWLAAVRAWIQFNTVNGNRITWGTIEPVRPQLTAKDVECLAAAAVAADRNMRQPCYDLDQMAPVEWAYEDELPKSFSRNIYSRMHILSKVDGVRLFPYIEDASGRHYLGEVFREKRDTMINRILKML